MWPFKRKEKKRENKSQGIRCTECGSMNTSVKPSYADGDADYIKTWRGQRYIIFYCRDCKRSFYVEESVCPSIDDLLNSDDVVDDEEELREAEEALKRQIEDDGDRRYR